MNDTIQEILAADAVRQETIRAAIGLALDPMPPYTEEELQQTPTTMNPEERLQQLLAEPYATNREALARDITEREWAALAGKGLLRRCQSKLPVRDWEETVEVRAQAPEKVRPDKDLVHLAMGAVSRDPERHAINGVLLDRDAQRIVATDGRLLVTIPHPVEESRIVLPGGAVRDALDFPGWRRIVPDYPHATLALDAPRSLADARAVQDLAPLLDRRTPKAKREGRYWDRVPLVKFDGPKPILFRADLIIRTLRILLGSGAGTVSIAFRDEESPVRFDCGNGAQAILMPFRIMPGVPFFYPYARLWTQS